MPKPGATTPVLALVPPPYDVGSTAAALEHWPDIVPGIETRAFTSFDRRGGNDDGFAGTWSELYEDDRAEHVIFDAAGPGVLRTLWFTSKVDGNGPLALGQVRFYFDGESEPRIAIDADALFAPGGSPFVAPLVAGNQLTSGGFASWAPLPYRGRLRITTERRAGFYAAHYETFPPDWNVDSYVARTEDAKLVDAFEATGPSALPLDDVALDTTVTGAGEIDVLRFEPTTPLDADPRAARLRITFDRAAKPQVDVPLPAFFGSGLGDATIRSVAWTMQPGLWESRLPMPFWESYRITVTGLSGKLRAHVSPSKRTRETAGYLEAHWNEARPTSTGSDFVYVDTTGTGKLIGTVLAVEPLAPYGETVNKQWWEGDLRSSADGRRTPSIHGTGHEDDHLGGWSNEFLSRPFTQPMQGCPKTELLDTNGQYNANASMYRLWPGITFTNALRHTTEHGAGNGRSLNYSSVAFLYRRPEPSTTRTDAFDVTDREAAAAHAYAAGAPRIEAITSAFEGEDASALSSDTHHYDSAVSFELAVDPKNDGVVLRRLFDATHGGERASIEVDGSVVATIYVAEYDPDRRWMERDVFLPPQITKGKTRLHVRLVPEGDFNAARFEAWSVKSPF
ncbi:hypothetical protein AKJ09_07871 [Labilithrix luteola]|uniref:DUF2961 domain-containing protein n=1 Tax=Labilithrix luteola TaxID=1391654 RepID=A0A0K1Q663_9BACT|nr:hypothetical protein AKJ09_07871 [Labilithrix luteola]